MSPISTIAIEQNELTSSHTFYSNDNSSTLVVMMPGGNNSCDRPLLQFIRDYVLLHNSDVLCISYKEITVQTDSIETKIEKIIRSIHQSIEYVSNDTTYNNMIFVSRSFGNIVSEKLQTKYGYNSKQNIHVSPISQALPYIKQHPGYIVSATEDAYLTQEDIKELQSLPRNEAIVFKGGNHSLKCDDVLATIEFHKQAMTHIINYLNMGQ